MRFLATIAAVLMCASMLAQCPGVQMQPLPFGGVEAKDSTTSVADSVCGFEYPCDSSIYFVWFQFEDTFYNGMRISIESSRADSVSILVVTGCNTVLDAVCRDIDITRELFLDHIGGIVSIHVAVPNPAKVTVRAGHAQQPTQPPGMNFPYTCSTTSMEEAGYPKTPRMRVYHYIDTGRTVIR